MYLLISLKKKMSGCRLFNAPSTNKKQQTGHVILNRFYGKQKKYIEDNELRKSDKSHLLHIQSPDFQPGRLELPPPKP